MEPDLPDPVLVVLIGAAGSGKTTWAARYFAPAEIVSSDALRGIVGSGPADLDASTEAFALLDQIVAGRTKRRLTTVVDTLGLDPARRQTYLAAARSADLPAIAVVLAAPQSLCRKRNAERDRPVPAAVLTRQLQAVRAVSDLLAAEGWAQVVVLDSRPEPVDVQAAPPNMHPEPPPTAPEPVEGPPATRPEPVEGPSPRATRSPATSSPAIPSAAAPSPGSPAAPAKPQLILQISRFPWGDDPASWLTAIALRADEIGLAGIAVMDHLIQIPQVGRAWEPIPEPWVTLGLLAGLHTRLKLGTLVSPVTFRAPGITAKAAATLDALSGGRAFLGLGAGWWDREHAAYGLRFPSAGDRLDELERSIETIRALWASGTKSYEGARVQLPETTCYPRPTTPIPIIVGGSGERRTLRIAARLADGCNLSSDPATLERKLSTLQRHCAEVGRDPTEVQITVLDLPVIGTNRADTSRRVEKLRGRTSATAFAARHHAGIADAHRRRYAQLAERGVSTVFVALPDLTGPEDLDRLAPLVEP